ncbi:phospholipid/cholesterol/gamma-HCH transport system ATP-binding protein [Haloechinothrix alba]|uniref:Phospholipid/cholesterol/gamma-HCH transport system ATP-binding protein n=1 Tax=Haloechinothrix alba TaxID=664784 RepID=A0A239AAG1_9PSEU|nr:ATP-binding cassette domain-containing protein [Haloechinothrix alba]SNR92392.1 phospholipid/cholesterol/gamma-HCH transport system ATP-binding protein [Haloechinothrix alba]
MSSLSGTVAGSIDSRQRVNGNGYTVELHGVRKSFDSGVSHVLDGVSVGFTDDAITTVLGPSGTGKSVLLKHIVGLLEPDEGDVVVFGQDLWRVSEAERYNMRKKFGVLFQDGALFGSMNLYDNVAFPLRKHTNKSEADIRDIVMSHLSEVGLEQETSKAPNEISGGMRKRAGLARALVMRPDVVLFDEPDSGLDPVRTKLLCQLIKEVHKEHGGTYIVITHDIESARTLSDYIGLLWHGQLRYYGAASEAFESDEPFVQQFLMGDAVGPLGMD